MNELPPPRETRQSRRHLGQGMFNILTSQAAWRRGVSTRMLFIFTVGVGVGFGLATLLHFPFEMTMPQIDTTTIISTSEEYTTEETTSKAITLAQLHHDIELNSSFAEYLLRGREEITSRKLAQEIRILCFVMTYPNNHKTKAIHVKYTWGRHCNTLLFVSEEADPELPSFSVNVKENRNGLWGKTVSAFKYIYKNYRMDYDWVMKADDDTYVIVENLRKMVLPYRPSDPHYFGFRFKPHAPGGYMSGGAGYALSKEAVERVVTKAFDNKHKDCPSENNTNSEDINIGKCLHAVGVPSGDSRDAKGRNRFFPFDIEEHVLPKSETSWWYTEYRYWPMKGGLGCCSDTPVTFHYVSTSKMYMLEFLVYYVNAFPVIHLATAQPITMSTSTAASTLTTNLTTTTQSSTITSRTSTIAQTKKLTGNSKEKQNMPSTPTTKLSGPTSIIQGFTAPAKATPAKSDIDPQMVLKIFNIINENMKKP